MKAFLILTTVCVFSFSTFSGASIHTLAEVKQENRMLAEKLINLSPQDVAGMSLKELSNITI